MCTNPLAIGLIGGQPWPSMPSTIGVLDGGQGHLARSQ
jgi:hypothetical protein